MSLFKQNFLPLLQKKKKKHNWRKHRFLYFLWIELYLPSFKEAQAPPLVTSICVN